eukprot:GFUD01042040.1.p1 GENE.GFUD01042040.1~~GFUD01042040.1.p1  ORF type:complete len:479 (-),score=129.67 GFUD01042040.1:38-1474(-)
MDPQRSGAPPSGSITCMLCRGSVPYAKNETQHFRSHLQHHHGVFYHHEVLISVNVLSKEYLRRIVQEYERSGDKSELVGEEDSEEVGELEETKENSSVILPAREKSSKKEAKVHNCRACNAKFGKLGDLIKHMNQHKAEEKKEQEQVEIKRQTLENERRRLIKEKRIIKQQKEIEKKGLDRNETNTRNRKDVHVGRSREIAEMKATLVGSPEDQQEQGRVVEEHSSQAGEQEPRPVVFECQECTYTTRRNIELKLHKLSHTEEKNFACEHCDEIFLLRQTLKRHVVKHTKEFAKKFKLNQTIVDEPMQVAQMDSSLPVKSFQDETMVPHHLSQFSSNLDQSMPKKKIKIPKVESAEGNMNVLSEDSTQDYPRQKARSSLGRGISEIAANSEYFQQFPNQIKKGLEGDDRFDSLDPTMPEGWKFREIRRPNGRVDKEFCSPDYMVFRSKKAMVEYMKSMGRYSQEEIDRAEKGEGRVSI